MDMICQMEEFYYENGIHSLAFSCPSKAECSSGCDKFTGPKSACIPEGYWKARPRIAFLSLDPGYGEGNPVKRTPLAVRNQGQFECDVTSLRKGAHWYETHHWATEIYNAVSQKEISIQESCSLFCHLNAAKCCQNNDGGRDFRAVIGDFETNVSSLDWYPSLRLVSFDQLLHKYNLSYLNGSAQVPYASSDRAI